MHRINSPRDVVATGVVQVDAGAGVRFAIPTESGGGGGDVTWATLPGKPAVFPSTIGGVDGLTAALAAKADTTHPLLYQSGNRNIAASVIAGWTVAARGVSIVRQGSTVTLSLDVTRSGAPLSPPDEPVEGAVGFASVLTIPTGFTPAATGFISPAKAGTGARPSGWLDRSGATLRFRDVDAFFPTDTRITNVITWQTLDAIPSTLPGTPA